ncbi:adenosine nucleotide hydrolase NudE [Catenovulum agarivorans DS-2]|uniref:Adenosine nucleotide hydrolase NudE n=2 Tax=Catenovulum agarivorans TaxID=1172192 RepID=W7QQ47_9ALTE|nr:adenosine nucleotide hydrolase NudE [Catenovulum agarivorans DS-2]
MLYFETNLLEYIKAMKKGLEEKVLPQILDSEVVAQSRLFRIETLQLKFSNGEEREYERLRGNRKGNGAVMMVPMLDDETFILVREYAAGTHDYQLGFPKGLIDQGETPEQAADRELQEEIGMGCQQTIALKSLTMAPGYFRSSMHILLAKSLYPQKLEGDEPEPLDIVPWSVHNIDELLAREDFTEARSVAALFLARKYFKTINET